MISCRTTRNTTRPTAKTTVTAPTTTSAGIAASKGRPPNLSIIALRERQKRNMLATLLLSQGVPMICGGDEMGRTQQGNNNAYCQDNEISWFDWNLTKPQQALLAFTKRLIALRQEHPVFRRRRFFQGRRIRGAEVKDLSWLRPDGKEMTDEDWAKGYVRCLGVRLAGHAIEEKDSKGRPIMDDTFLILLNAHHEPRPFTLPAHKRGVRVAAGAGHGPFPGLREADYAVERGVSVRS